MSVVTNFDFATDAVGHGCYAIDLDGHVQSFPEDIRDALRARGLLSLDEDGVWHLAWHGFDLRREGAQYLACCDFCSARPVTWTVRCESFVVAPLVVGQNIGPPLHSEGDWAACDACGLLVSTGQRRQLLERVLMLARQAPRGLSRTLRRAHEALHRQFWRHYQGGTARVPPRPFGH